MQTITKYRANDGTEHKTESDCLRWESDIAAATEALLPLGDRPKLTHGTYITHDIANCNQARSNLLRLMRVRHPEMPWEKWGDDDSQYHPLGILGRYLDDYGSPFNRAWSRLRCINFDSGREYDQPYFASHEDEANPA